MRQAALVNTLENFGYVFKKALEGFFIDRMEKNEEITAKFLNDQKFRDIVTQDLTERAYELVREEVVIVKGQMTKAEKTIVTWFEDLQGDIIAELDFIDWTTFGYLDSIPKNCGIQIIASNVKDGNKFIRQARKCAMDRPHLEIIKINKIHERWIGSENSYFLEIGTDLKSDALGRSTHTITKLAPRDFQERITKFKQFWNTPQKKLRQLYGSHIEKEQVFRWHAKDQ